jgi:hypothetical protein
MCSRQLLVKLMYCFGGSSSLTLSGLPAEMSSPNYFEYGFEAAFVTPEGSPLGGMKVCTTSTHVRKSICQLPQLDYNAGGWILGGLSHYCGLFRYLRRVVRGCGELSRLYRWVRCGTISATFGQRKQMGLFIPGLSWKSQ